VKKIDQSLITIYIPTFNNEKTIIKTLNSLINQSYKNFIIKIFDNLSTDNTLHLINDLKCEKVLIFKSKFHISAIENFNRCLKDFSSKYACIYHSDDLYHKDILKEQVAFFKRHNVMAVFTDGYAIDEKDKFVKKILSSKKVKYLDCINFPILFKFILKNFNFLLTPSVMFDAEKFKIEKIGYFDHKNYGQGSDLDMWLRLSCRVDGIGILQKKLVYYRISSEQLSYKDRMSINNSSFFKVTENYLKKKEVLNILDKQDFLNYKILLLIDDCFRIINLLIKDNFLEANNLLKKISIKNLGKIFYNIKAVKLLVIYCIIFILIKFNFKKFGPKIAIKLKKIIH
jgi:glycosyltransferase involved in cell wall biosynthesis